ncbi:hypothetical protein MKC48_21575, partial [[Clostridium] innocuum]|nr:hypothetical protein [[Clostridium] innocuum]
AFSKAGSGGVKTEYKVYARGSNPVTITGLEARTKYYIYVKAVGENGHLDSEYTSQSLEVTTKNPFVKGTLEITSTGTGYRYGDTLNVAIKGEDQKQTGDYTWYLVNDDGSRGSALTTAARDGYSILLQDTNYIGHRLEVVLAGTGNYGGEISAQSEIIQLAEQSFPAQKLINKNVITDSTVEVQLPTLSESLQGERFNIGYSKLEDGVPEEYRPDNKKVQYSSGQSALIKGLQRNTTYYFFLRFDANKNHEKSDWASEGISIKTLQTQFDGAIYFEYGNNAIDAPTQGERLVARLGQVDQPGTKPNTTDGTWSWYKIANGTETEIKEFYPGGDGYSTYYEIPKNEEPGTTYRAVFKFHEDYTKTLNTGVETDKVERTSE